MSFESTPLTADSDARDIDMLQELAEITMALSRSLGHLALEKAAEGDAKAAGDLGIVVTRVGRALRQTIAYRRKIEDQARERDSKSAADVAEVQARQAENQSYARQVRSANRKQMIRHAVEQVLNSQDDKDRFDELDERLDDYESFTDFTDRPVSEFVANLCNALGLEFDWSQFEYDPWAMQEAETKPEGSPFAEWWASIHDDPADDPPDTHARNSTGPPLAAE